MSEYSHVMLLIAICASMVLILGVANAEGWEPLASSQIEHPVLDYGIVPEKAEQYEKAVQRVMAMSDEEMLSFVPEKPFNRFCYCPNCHGGSQGSGIFTWTIDRPEELKCKYCGMVFPNEKYPCDQLMEGQNEQGETVSYWYHKDQKRDDLREFLPSHLQMYKRDWIMGQARALANAYQATGNEEYARRVVLILHRISEVYPRYPMMRQWITTFAFPERQAPPYTSAGGKWGRWMASELPAGVPEIYDLVYESEEFDKLSAELKYDVRQKFEEDFLRATWDYTNTFAEHNHNMAPFYLSVSARMGRIINEPRYVHWAYKWLLDILEGKCYYDGMWHEAPSYHYQVMGGLRNAFSQLKGYTDPPGYVDEEDGVRFDNLDPDKDIAFYATAKDAPGAVAFPNGLGSPIHDTWPMSKTADVRTETVSALLPGYGHASLGRGAGSDQMQAQLHYSGCHGHSHYDNLTLTLFAKGREMLSDLGYTHTKLRSWAISTVGHNTVVIDRKGQQSKHSDGRLVAYFPGTGGVSMVEADGQWAYESAGAETYRRMLVTVPVSANDAYVVDVFRVLGGETHDWLLHGSANDDMTAECSVELPEIRENMMSADETWVEPKTEGSRVNPYGCIRDVRAGATNGGFDVAFRYADNPEKGVRVFMPSADCELYLGKSPSVRKARNDSQKVWDSWMPQLIVRRQGTAPLLSTFVAVEQPFDGEEFVDGVTPVALLTGDGEGVAVAVEHGDAVDTIICANDPESDAEFLTDDGIRMTGRFGVVRRVNGVVQGAWLFEGTELSCHGFGVTSPVAAYEGEVAGMTRIRDGADVDAFLTDAELPVGDDLAGTWMVMTRPDGFVYSYEIVRVDEAGGQRRIVVNGDHGLRMEDGVTREVYYPRGDFEGICNFRIPLSVGISQPE